MPDHVVVVGGGMAAVRLVEQLAGADVRLTVLADEPHAPYNRILLSAVLEGTHSADALTLRSTAWFEANGIDLRLGARVLAQYQSGAQTRRVRALPDDGPFVEVHPSLAGRLGVVSGDAVRISTRRGTMTAPARVVTTIRPDTVFIPFHWVGANRLTNDALDPASKMPEFKVCAAQLSLVEDVAQRPSQDPVTHA